MRRTRRFTFVVVTMMLVQLGSAGPAGAEAHAPRAATGRPTLVGTDPAGDWSVAGNTSLNPAGDALGEDLVKATITQDARNLDFVMELASLPAEALTQQSFYMWGFHADGVDEFLTSGCNPFEPTTCPDSVSHGLGFQLVRCDSSIAIVASCSTVAVVAADVDVAAKTITIPVPLRSIGVHRSSVVSAGSWPVEAGPARQESMSIVGSSTFVGDDLLITKDYVVR